ncbi:hypothetical protein DFQ26_000971 [Actinomortierella ambigua]|nr:hypothetical protein DFQ26_000971 [Actinomortierella ambigua]
MSSATLPMSFAAGEDIALDGSSGSPGRGASALSTPRQRRVSSVSSSNSIRQVGTYGGMGTLASPARKANPYHTGALARFSPGMTNATILGSPRRKSSSSSVGGTMLALQEAAAMAPPVPPLPPAQSTTPPPPPPPSSLLSPSASSSAATTPKPPPPPISTTPSMLSMALQQLQQHQQQQGSEYDPRPIVQPVATFMFDEEYSVEKDSVYSSVQSTPTLARPHPLSSYVPRNTTTPSPQPRVLLPSTSGELRAFEVVEDFATPRSSVVYPPVATTTTTSGTVVRDGFEELLGDEEFALRNEGVVITEYGSDEHEDDEDDNDDDEDDDDNDDDDEDDDNNDNDEESLTETEDGSRGRGPHASVDTLHTSATGSHTLGTDSAAGSTTQRRRASYVSSSRRSVAASHNSGAARATASPRPPAPSEPPMASSAVVSSSSRPRVGVHPPAMLSRQWSESSYDPCGPMRWDELLEMDPNSKGPLWLSNRGLGQISNEFFDGLRNLRELYLDHNDIKMVPDSLLKLTKLDVLDLSWNSLSSFHAAFKLKKLKNLRRLNLDHNLLTDISPLYKLKSLRELRLNHNLVQYLAMNLQHLTKLKILAIESNQIATLPESMGRLSNLCELRLSDNSLRVLPDAIGSIRTLQILALRSNLLEKLPESWKDLESLTTLDLACNRLTSLPPDLVRLPRLTHLDLHDNQLQVLPEKIGMLSNLVVLQLCNNHLRELPRDIGRLRDMQDLVLSFNRLVTLPDEIGKLTKLQELKWNNNPLRELPRTIQKLSQVRRVHFQGCRLQQLPVALGVAFKDLTYVDLSDNQFEVLPALDQMHRVEELYISHNLIRDLGSSALYLAGSVLSGSGSISAATGASVAAAAAAAAAATAPTSSSISGSVQSSASNTLTSNATGTLSNTTAVNETASPEGVMSISTGPASGAGLMSMLAAANAASSSANSGNNNNISGGISSSLGMMGGSGSGSGGGGGGGGSGQHHRSSIGAGVTASKLADLKHLRVLEAHHNQIRVLTEKIKLLRGLEVLDVSHNLLDGVPKEVGELSLLKVLVLEGNPIQALPSTLSRLMGSLEIFQIGDWPEHGFEITRDQTPINMKVNILQSAMPRQIERTLLWRMHEAILKRAHELDSRKDPYPNGYESRIPMERFRPRGNGLLSTAATGTTTLALASSTVYSLQRQLRGEDDDDEEEADLASHGGPSRLSKLSGQQQQQQQPALQLVPKKSHHMGIAQGLAMATRHIMHGRGFGGLSSSTTASETTSQADSRRMDDNHSMRSSSYSRTGGSSSPTVSAFSTDSRASVASTPRALQPDMMMVGGRRYSKESSHHSSSEYETTSTTADVPTMFLNMEGIHPNTFATTRHHLQPPPPLLPTHLQIATPPSILGLRSTHDFLTASPLSEFAPSPTVGGSGTEVSSSLRLTAPNNPTLRARHSAQQLGSGSIGNSGGTKSRGGGGASSKKLRPTSMYTSMAGLANDEDEVRLQKPVIGYALQHHKASMSNTDLATGGGGGLRPMGANRRSSYEYHHQRYPHPTAALSGSLYLNADAMTGLGIGTEPGTAGSVIAHSNGPFTSSARLEVPVYRSGTKGSGDLTNLKTSLAIKSSPTLGSLPLFAPTGNSGLNNSKGLSSAATMASNAAMSLSRPRSPTPNPMSMVVDNGSGIGANGMPGRIGGGNASNVSQGGGNSNSTGGGPLSRLGMAKAFQRSASPSGLARSTSQMRSSSAASPTPRPETPSALPWLRLKTSSSTPAGPSMVGSPVDSPGSTSSPRHLDTPTTKSNHSTLKRANSSSVKITASAILSGLTGAATASPGAVVHGSNGGTGGLNVTTPPPILLDYELGTSSSLDLPSQFYYNPSEPVEGDVDVDPSTERKGRGRRGRRDGVVEDGDNEANDDEDEDEEEHLIDEEYHGSSSYAYDAPTATATSTLGTNEYGTLDPSEYTMPSHRDPVLKIAVLKGVYDQILYNYENAHQRHMSGHDAYWSSEDGTLGGGGGPGGPGGIGAGPGGIGAGGRDGFGSHRGGKKSGDRFKLLRFLSPLSAHHQQQHHHPQPYHQSSTMSSMSQRGSKDYSPALHSEQAQQQQQQHTHSLFQYPAQHLSNVVHTT